jgi:hypothetical protein
MLAGVLLPLNPGGGWQQRHCSAMNGPSSKTGDDRGPRI